MGLGERAMEWMFENIVTWLVCLVIVAVVLLVIALPFLIYADSQAERFALRKDEWTCSASIERATTTYVQSGNVMVPITTHSKHCTQWTERP